MKPTVALNMIIGPGDGALAKRALESYTAREAFDEIILVNTSSGDPEVEAVCREWSTVQGLRFEWHSEKHPFGDFAGARNAAIKASSSDYIWWLDADDIYKGRKSFAEQMREKILPVIEKSKPKVILQGYALQYSEDGGVIQHTVRHRAWNAKAGMRWAGAVHEELPWWDFVQNESEILFLKNIYNFHSPVKGQNISASRNLSILQNEYNKGDRSARVLFYLGRDSIAAGEQESGILFLTEMLKTFPSGCVYAPEACMFLAEYFLTSQKIPKEDLAELYLFLASIYERECAEIWVSWGDAIAASGDMKRSELFYRRALASEYGASHGMVQKRPFYEAIPSMRLSALAQDRGDLEEALYLNAVARKTFPSDGYLSDQRMELIEKLADTLSVGGK